MTLQERIATLIQLGNHLQEKDDFLDATIKRTTFNNAWLTEQNQYLAIQTIANNFLDGDKLKEWIHNYNLSTNQPKNVAIIISGNTPLAGFQDIFYAFVAGQYAQIKLSENDRFVLPYFIKLLNKFDERTIPYFTITDTLSGYDAVIADSTNTTQNYLEKYFSHLPNIIRPNQKAIAVLSGDESNTHLQHLALDIFSYFGLSTRSIAKIYVPRGYKFEPLLETLHQNNKIILHSKYKNNFDYNYSMFIINRTEYMANGCIILKEDQSLDSRIACLHYEFYDEIDTLQKHLQEVSSQVSCIVSTLPLEGVSTIDFGQTINTQLYDYPANIDTMVFLSGLK